MTINVIKVSDMQLECSQTSCRFFAKTINVFCKKAPSSILGWVQITARCILRGYGIGAFWFFQYKNLFSYDIKYPPCFQKYIAKCHIDAFLIVREVISNVLKEVNKELQKKGVWDKSPKGELESTELEY